MGTTRSELIEGVIGSTPDFILECFLLFKAQAHKGMNLSLRTDQEDTLLRIRLSKRCRRAWVHCWVDPGGTIAISVKTPNNESLEFFELKLSTAQDCLNLYNAKCEQYNG
jgi:hypothetical protein